MTDNSKTSTLSTDSSAAENTSQESQGIEELVGEWTPLPDIAEALDVSITAVHQLVSDGSLLALRIGEGKVRKVPAAFIQGNRVLDSLKGTISVLRDARYSDEDAIRWLFTPDESLPGTPVDAMIAGRKTEIRRRAQALAW